MVDNKQKNDELFPEVSGGLSFFALVNIGNEKSALTDLEDKNYILARIANLA